jgi:hypothetical protein
MLMKEQGGFFLFLIQIASWVARLEIVNLYCRSVGVYWYRDRIDEIPFDALFPTTGFF